MAPVNPPTSANEHCQCVFSEMRLNFDLSTQPLACWPSHPSSNEHLQVSMRVFKEDSTHPKRGAGSKTPPPTICTLSLSLYLYLTTRRQELAWKPLRPLTIRHCTPASFSPNTAPTILPNTALRHQPPSPHPWALRLQKGGIGHWVVKLFHDLLCCGCFDF